MLLDEGDEDAFGETLDMLREELEEAEWGFCFARMHTETADYGYDIQLDVYQVDAWACYKFAELTLEALHNLISPNGGNYLEESLEKFLIWCLKTRRPSWNMYWGFLHLSG